MLASVIGNGLWNSASRRLPLTMTGQLVVFETLFALVYSFAWERRWPTPLEGCAITAMLAGVWWCASLHRHRSSGARLAMDDGKWLPGQDSNLRPTG